MPWAALDDGFHEDPRTLEAGLAAAGLYACATCYVARHLLDGRIPDKAVARMLDGGDMEPLDTLLRVGLFTKADEGGYEVADYFKGNQTRAVVEKRREDKKQRASNAANARWRKKRDADADEGS